MNNDRFHELATLYLSNEISDDEIKELESFLEDNSVRREFDVISAKWENSKPNQELFSLEEGLELVTNKLKNVDEKFEWSNEIPDRKTFINTSMILRYAAAILLVVTGSLILYFSVFSSNGAIEQEWNEKITSLGKKSIIKYADGTKITLNSDSKLKYPKEFIGEKREIYLEGEAYFEVATDSTKPFIVYSGTIRTEVLGTKFNVNAFPYEKNIIVSLIEGKVRVQNDNPNLEETESTLTPNLQVTYNKNDNTSMVENFDSLEVVGWKTNILAFDDEPLLSVFKKLERTYGVKFKLKTHSHQYMKLTAKFNNENIWTVVKVIEKVTGLNHQSVEENNELVEIIFE